jgi:hypothetical protein
MVSGYGMDNRAIQIRSQGICKRFFLQPLCPNRLWGPPSLLTKGTGDPFRGVKARPGRDADHSPHLVLKS